MKKNRGTYNFLAKRLLQELRILRALRIVLRRSHIIFGVALAVSLAGCSIRPLPKNVTRDATLEIINKIRCETREVLIDRFLVVLNEPNKGRLEVSETNLKLLRELEHMGTSQEVMSNIKWNQVDDETLTRVTVFAASVISYAFKFTASEQKKKNGKATFSMPFIGGSMGLSIGGGSNKTRKNFRQITMSDTFHSLVTGKNPPGNEREFTGLDCDLVDQPRKHWIYPITGNIGMAEVINTFVDMELASGPKPLKTFSDRLRFTTNLEVSANPVVILNPPVLPKHFRLIKGDANYKAFRKDQHEVRTVLKQAEFSLQPPMETVIEDLGYIKLSEFKKKDIPNFPDDHEIGLNFKRTYDRPKVRGGIPGRPTGIRAEFARPPSRKLFIAPMRVLKPAINENLKQLKRLEDEEKQSVLDAVVDAVEGR